jgi:DNA-binding response OmpR family regulator
MISSSKTAFLKPIPGRTAFKTMKGDKILIIEDDPTMQRVLKDNFEFSGYDVRVVSDGAAAIETVFAQEPDVILLDIMLPRVNGFDVCRRIRKEGLATPIIMLTAKSQESDIVLGLNLGADDYVAKPFSMEVLLARVQACLRRKRPGGQVEEFEFGECRLNAHSHRLFRSGIEVELTPKEFKLLEYFVQNAGRALTRQRILDGVWGEDLIVTERSVDRCVTTLRTKVEPDPERPRFIKTIRDVGYRFEAT